MKKLVFGLIATVVFGFVGNAQDSVSNKSNSIENLYASNEISTSFSESNSNLVPNKVAWPRWRWLTIAGADIIGAGTGVWAVKEIGAAFGTFTGGVGTTIVYAGAAIICGAGASHAASKGVPKKNSYKTDAEIKGAPIDNIGQLHNLMLENCYFGETDKIEFLKKYFDSCSIELLLSNKDFNKINENILELSNQYSSSDYNINEYIDGLYNVKYMSSEMKTFYVELFKALDSAENYDEAQNVILKFEENLNNSKYDDFTKLCLSSSLNTAKNSFPYWYEQ